MEFDLQKARKQYGLSVEEFAGLCGISPYYYMIYEKEKQIPCKYIYLLWKSLPDFPIPNDFFYYTSLTLRCNMVYYNMSQNEIAEKFGTIQQTISHYMTKGPILMYELKDKFLECFKIIIVPYVVEQRKNGMSKGKLYTDYKATGNFMATERKKNNQKAVREEM